MNKGKDYASVEIRKIASDHFADSMALSQFAFQYMQTGEELERSKEQYEVEPANRYAAFVNGQFAAQATVLELETFIGDKRFAMGGVAGVATWPEHRRQGLVAQLLIHSLKEMKLKGQSVSLLHPFSFSFYRKFGWETYTEHKAYTIKSEQLPSRKSYPGRIQRQDGYSGLNDMYEAYASRYNGTLARTDLWWTYRINSRKPGQIAVYYDPNDRPLGYIIYEVKNMKLHIHELIALNEQAREALWSFIAQHDSMLDEVTLTAPSDDMLPYLLPNPRIKQEIVPYFMARIVDAEAFVEQYAFHADSVEDLIYIQLSDEHASWNSGEFMLQINTSGKARLSRIAEKEQADAAIKMDIGSFTSMLLGYVRPLQLSQLDKIKGDNAAIKRLHARIPERTTYLLDFF
ncbi:GNAT family N-acetyltransferase [Paenibacillus sp. sgz302251]|uniref:GNAT family N-acetyltransferase n=1 Tax=Paenibacillus sp. sgz302251 TaxID=3414493 RepID=UPI003C7C7A58